MKAAIVILNYLNYKDTIECVDSILAMKYSIEGIVIVENGSKNASLKKLKEKYEKINEVHILENSENLGFAKGNNIGIAYARKVLDVNSVFVANNDTVFLDPQYIDKILSKALPNVGVVDGRVKCRRGHYNPRIKVSITYPGVIFRYLGMLLLLVGCKKIATLFFGLENRYGNKVEAPQGSALLFAPGFFKYYEGFYPETFLYSEEHILTILLKKAKLKMAFVPGAEIYHKEDMSSGMSFMNDSKKKLKLEIKSFPFVLKTIGMSLKEIQNKYGE